VRYTLFDITESGGHLRLYLEDGIYTASMGNGSETATLTVPAFSVPAVDGSFALRYDDNEFALLFNGEVLASLFPVIPPAIESISGTMHLGCDSSGNQWDDVIGPARGPPLPIFTVN
jgi:hypothetical protein